MNDDDERREPLDVINEAQSHALQLGLILKLAFTLTVAAAAFTGLSLIERFRTAGLALTVFVVAGLFGMLLRAKKELFHLRLLQAQVYLLHKDKGHQTCGSMDPHFTKART